VIRHGTPAPGGGRLPVKPPLPPRDGVAASRLYLPDGPWRVLGDFLPGRFPHIPPVILAARLAAGDIVDSDGVAQRADSPYRPRSWLWYYREAPAEACLPFDLPILFMDDRLIVVDKPHFLASIPGGRHVHETALTRLRRTLDCALITPLHRLDRDTAGVLVFCRDPTARGAYQTLFQSRRVRKQYEALAPVREDLDLPLTWRSRLEPVPGRFVMHEAPGEPNSETRIVLEDVFDTTGIASMPVQGAGLKKVGRYRLYPVTGRKHQLRAHMSGLGIPILNDAFYPEPLPKGREDDFGRPLKLLARSIEFEDPYTGRLRRFETRRSLPL